jgi:hypothetical protein
MGGLQQDEDPGLEIPSNDSEPMGPSHQTSAEFDSWVKVCTFLVMTASHRSLDSRRPMKSTAAPSRSVAGIPQL